MLAVLTNLAPDSAPLLNWAVVIAACCVATIIDVRCRRIPNKLTGPLLLAGYAWWTLVRGFDGLGEAFGGMLVAGLPFILLWMIGGGGAGDAKMMLAIGCWLGINDAFLAAIATGLAGGILSIIYAKAHRRLLMAMANTAWMVMTMPLVLLGPGRIQDRQKLAPPSADGPLKTPYSIAMLAGTCAALAWIFVCRA